MCADPTDGRRSRLDEPRAHKDDASDGQSTSQGAAATHPTEGSRHTQRMLQATPSRFWKPCWYGRHCKHEDCPFRHPGQPEPGQATKAAMEAPASIGLTTTSRQKGSKGTHTPHTQATGRGRTGTDAPPRTTNSQLPPPIPTPKRAASQPGGEGDPSKFDAPRRECTHPGRQGDAESARASSPKGPPGQWCSGANVDATKDQ